jgi:XTP/dITP diphosphohydrolase
VSADRILEPGRLVLATHNAGKAPELRALVEPLGFDVVTAGELGLAEPEETEPTFVGNAELKARAAAIASGLPALADDSGLAIRALGGAPGIYSARWAGPAKDFQAAMARVARELDGKDDRAAEFVCVLSVAWPDGAVRSFEGRVAGAVVWPPRGDKGFGYDPIFAPYGHAKTFGEMEPTRKHAMSHRARAFDKLLAWLRGQG